MSLCRTKNRKIDFQKFLPRRKTKQKKFVKCFYKFVDSKFVKTCDELYLSSSSEDDEEEESFSEMFLLTGLAFNSTGFFLIFFCLLKKSRSFVLSSFLLPPSPVEQSRRFTLGWSNVPLSLNIFLGSKEAVMVKYDMNHSKFVKNREFKF